MNSDPRPAARDGTQEVEPENAPPAGGTEPPELWRKALDLLRHQVPADKYAGLLEGTRVVEATKDAWTIGVGPHLVQWAAGRPNLLIKRTVNMLAGHEVRLAYVAEERPAAENRPAVPPPEAPAASPRPCASPSPPVQAKPQPRTSSGPAGQRPGSAGPAGQESAPSVPRCRKTADSGLARLLSFDPNSAKGGGFWKMGHYANWFWAAYLGTVAWRVYELVVSGDKRPHKTLWTPPRRFSVSELARAIASGRQRRPNRDQIRGRFRRVNGERVWSPGAFDLLTREEVARIEWHAGDAHWRPWRPGGSNRPGKSGIRVVYRISVVTSLPLLTPRQVARLPAQNQVEHERYLANRAQDLIAWEQIGLSTLAGLDTEEVAGHGKPGLTPRRQ